MSDSCWKDPHGYIGAAEEDEAEINRLNAALAAANERIRELEQLVLIQTDDSRKWYARHAAEREVSDKLVAALVGLHQVCEIALAGKDGLQHTYFETRGGSFVEATQAMTQAETALAEVAALRKGQA